MYFIIYLIFYSPSFILIIVSIFFLSFRRRTIKEDNAIIAGIYYVHDTARV